MNSFENRPLFLTRILKIAEKGKIADEHEKTTSKWIYKFFRKYLINYPSMKFLFISYKFLIIISQNHLTNISHHLPFYSTKMKTGYA